MTFSLAVCVCLCVCVRACVRARLCDAIVADADGCILLIMLADVCQSCRLLYVCTLTAFQDTFLAVTLGE